MFTSHASRCDGKNGCYFFPQFFFVVRAAWDDNTDWIYRSSEALRNNSGYEYAEDFVPVSKKHGFFEKIISMKKNTKLREILDLFADHTGYRITISQFGKKRKVPRRQKCVFNWNVNVVTSDGSKALPVSQNPELDDFKRDNGDVVLYELDGKLMPQNIFRDARLLFKRNDERVGDVVLENNRDEIEKIKKRKIVKKDGSQLDVKQKKKSCVAEKADKEDSNVTRDKDDNTTMVAFAAGTDEMYDDSTLSSVKSDDLDCLIPPKITSRNGKQMSQKSYDRIAATNMKNVTKFIAKEKEKEDETEIYALIQQVSICVFISSTKAICNLTITSS